METFDQTLKYTILQVRLSVRKIVDNILPKPAM